MNRLKLASEKTGIKHIAIAGGVSANSEIRRTLKSMEASYGWTTYIPKFEFTTDNAAMIGISGYLKFLEKDFDGEDSIASSRLDMEK
jgi:N6-L-threonylcarbamoyladenine synthase